MKPVWTITANGADVTATLADRFERLSLELHSGGQADELVLELDDRKPHIELPALTGVLTVKIGYEGEELLPMGQYTVAELEPSGPPNKLLVRARAAVLGSAANTAGSSPALKERRTRAWSGASVGTIALAIASDLGVAAKVSPTLAGVVIPQVDQVNESDASLISRLGYALDAHAFIGNGELVISPKGTSVAVSGASLPAVALSPTGQTRWHATLSSRSAYGTVKARWRDRDAAQDAWWEVGSGTPVAVVARRQPDQATAELVAKAHAKRLARGTGSLELSMPGDPRIAGASPLDLSGFRTGVNGHWYAKRVRHAITRQGYVTRLDAHR